MVKVQDYLYQAKAGLLINKCIWHSYNVAANG